jgi:hypothetical protein
MKYCLFLVDILLIAIIFWTANIENVRDEK